MKKFFILFKNIFYIYIYFFFYSVLHLLKNDYHFFPNTKNCIPFYLSKMFFQDCKYFKIIKNFCSFLRIIHQCGFSLNGNVNSNFIHLVCIVIDK